MDDAKNLPLLFKRLVARKAFKYKIIFKLYTTSGRSTMTKVGSCVTNGYFLMPFWLQGKSKDRQLIYTIIIIIIIHRFKLQNCTEIFALRSLI